MQETISGIDAVRVLQGTGTGSFRIEVVVSIDVYAGSRCHPRVSNEPNMQLESNGQVGLWLPALGSCCGVK